jgi:tetratricopeptide (TPR) repeat protein
LDTANEALRIDSSYQSAKDVQKKARDAIDKAAKEEVARKEAADKVAREEVTRKEAIEKAVKEKETHKKAEEENINQFLNHLRDGVTCLQDGETELAENNFDEAIEACNRAEQHFNNAHHQRLLNILSECYIKLIILYNEAGNSGAAQALWRKCSENMFINSKYATIFEKIPLNMQASDQMQLINFISGMDIHPVEEIADQVIQLIGSQNFGE